jgi:hypothetical protein
MKKENTTDKRKNGQVAAAISSAAPVETFVLISTRQLLLHHQNILLNDRQRLPLNTGKQISTADLPSNEHLQDALMIP